MHCPPTAIVCGAPTVVVAVPGIPLAVMYWLTRAVHIAVAVARQDRDSRSFSRGVRDDFVALKQEAEVRDAQHHEQQRRKHQRELDQLRAAFGSPQPPPTRFAGCSIQRSHSVTIIPARIGTA